MVDLTEIKCQNCDFNLKLLIGTSNLDQVYNDLNDDFNYHKIFYCPSHRIFTSLETFNLNQFQLTDVLLYFHGVETGCANTIEIEDATKIPPNIPCPNCNRIALRFDSKNLIEI